MPQRATSVFAISPSGSLTPARCIMQWAYLREGRLVSTVPPVSESLPLRAAHFPPPPPGRKIVAWRRDGGRADTGFWLRRYREGPKLRRRIRNSIWATAGGGSNSGERRKSPQTRTAGTHTLTQREERDLTSSQWMCFFFNVWLAVSAPRQPRRKNLNRRRRVTRFYFVRSLSRLSPERVFLGVFFLRKRAAFNSIAFAEFPLCWVRTGESQRRANGTKGAPAVQTEWL